MAKHRRRAHASEAVIAAQLSALHRKRHHPHEHRARRRAPNRQPSVHARADRASPIRATSEPTHLQMNKQINLVINGKGGVGKSFFATNIVQYLKDCGIAHSAIDSDHENSTLKRFHPEAEFINLEHRRRQQNAPARCRCITRARDLDAAHV
jgi:Mrp family chromosome partitioning ATPase